MSEQVSISSEWLSGIRAFILDMDGVLYRGNAMIPEVPRFLDALAAGDIAYMMATNNATATPEQYIDKLGGMGIEVEPGQIVTSALATGTYLRDRYPSGSKAYVVGMDALRDAVFGDGHFVEDTRNVDVVVSGADFRLTYDSLKTACLCIRAGADYVATNADTTFPSEEGLIPGSGAIVAALVASGGKEPTIVGKPSPVMVETCLKMLGTSAEETIMLGDRLDTDILAGERAGTHTVLVTTGISNVTDIEAEEIYPDVVVPTLDAISELLEQLALARR
ncbi:MAG: HAD-IIA family hydrolase [Chloroflexota bacterium]